MIDKWSCLQGVDDTQVAEECLPLVETVGDHRVRHSYLLDLLEGGAFVEFCYGVDAFLPVRVLMGLSLPLFHL